MYQGSQGAWAKAIAGGAPVKQMDLEPSWFSEWCHGAVEAEPCRQPAGHESQLMNFEGSWQLSVLCLPPEMGLAHLNSGCFYLKVGISSQLSLSAFSAGQKGLKSLLATSGVLVHLNLEMPLFPQDTILFFSSEITCKILSGSITLISMSRTKSAFSCKEQATLRLKTIE